MNYQHQFKWSCIALLLGVGIVGCSDASNEQAKENTEGVCHDELDNDDDGAADCDDVECLAFCGLHPLPEGTLTGGLRVDDRGRVVTDGDTPAEGWPDTVPATYNNPVLPGDHPDMNLFQDGDDFYIIGSSFAISPNVEILHSKDLVHWERVSRVVRPDWSGLKNVNDYGGGTWGGFIRKFDGLYWVYFSVNFGQYFATAESLEGPWEDPVRVNGDTGYDDSIFVDDDGTAYLLVKHDQCAAGVNLLHEIGENGQLTGEPIDLKFINDELCAISSNNWAEGPTMAKRDGMYYYFASTHTGCGGVEYAWRSSVLSDNPDDWESLGVVLKGDLPFSGSQHSSAPIELPDGTWWAVYHSYDCSEWRGLGRQGLLSQVTWDENGVPVFEPAPLTEAAPALSSGGIPWLKPVNDDFESGALGPHWTFYGYTPNDRYSVTKRAGWLTVTPDGDETTYVVQKTVPFANAMLALMDFKPSADGEEAGIRNGNAINSIEVKVSRLWDGGDKLRFSFNGDNTDTTAPGDSRVWLKLDSRNHVATGWYSLDRLSWKQIGGAVDIKSLDNFDALATGWVGNQSGVFATGKAAAFDRFAYRDGFSNIPAGEPDNQSGGATLDAEVLGNLADGHWALFGSVDLGGPDSNGVGIRASAVELSVSSESDGASVEVWLDPTANGALAATCDVPNTGSFDTFETVTCDLSAVGSREVYLRARGDGDDVVHMDWFRFVPAAYAAN